MIIALLAILYLTSPQAYEQLSIINYADLSAKQNQIDSDYFRMLISCESSFKIDAAGDWRLEDQIYLSHGLFQFQKPTFYHYAKIYNITGEWKNPYSQISLAALMIKDGLWYKWYNCGKRVGYDKLYE